MTILDQEIERLRTIMRVNDFTIDSCFKFRRYEEGTRLIFESNAMGNILRECMKAKGHYYDSTTNA